MTHIEAALRSHALADTDVAALIGARWYGPTLQQFSNLPAVTVQCISNGSEHSHGGYSGVERARYQVTVWADSQLSALDVTAALNRLLDGFRGTLGAGSAAVPVDRLWKAGRTDLGLEPGQNVYRIAVDYFIDYRVIE